MTIPKTLTGAQVAEIYELRNKNNGINPTGRADTLNDMVTSGAFGHLRNVLKAHKQHAARRLNNFGFAEGTTVSEAIGYIEDKQITIIKEEDQLSTQTPESSSSGGDKASTTSKRPSQASGSSTKANPGGVKTARRSMAKRISGAVSSFTSKVSRFNPIKNKKGYGQID